LAPSCRSRPPKSRTGHRCSRASRRTRVRRRHRRPHTCPRCSRLDRRTLSRKSAPRPCPLLRRCRDPRSRWTSRRHRIQPATRRSLSESRESRRYASFWPPRKCDNLPEMARDFGAFSNYPCCPAAKYSLAVSRADRGLGNNRSVGFCVISRAEDFSASKWLLRGEVVVKVGAYSRPPSIPETTTKGSLASTAIAEHWKNS